VGIDAAAPPASSAPTLETAGASLVGDAFRALRQGTDPESAARAVERYLREYPRGSLAEEALALGLEAAAAQKNDERLLQFADDYLRRFARGRFREVAQQARRSVLH
jgi:hypothetical protein